jgi:aryl-alcohol dehydrogenase-like predicted oxidoreductase
MAERETGLSLSQFALAWVLRRQEVSSAIIGASRPEQVTENAAAADRDVAPELFVRVEEILAPLTGTCKSLTPSWRYFKAKLPRPSS